MPTVDPALLAEQARTLAADLRATYNAGEVKAQRAATLLDILADALAPSSAPTSEPRLFKVGDRVRIARKVVIDSNRRDCGWFLFKNAALGLVGVVSDIDPDDWAMHVAVDLGHGRVWWFSPEALDLLPAEDGQ